MHNFWSDIKGMIFTKFYEILKSAYRALSLCPLALESKKFKLGRIGLGQWFSNSNTH